MGLSEAEIIRRYHQNLGKKGGSVKGVKKGFAALTPERRAEIGRKGGLASRKRNADK